MKNTNVQGARCWFCRHVAPLEAFDNGKSTDDHPSYKCPACGRESGQSPIIEETRNPERIDAPRAALEKIVEYLADEEANYRAATKAERKNHVWRHVKAVKDALEAFRTNLTAEERLDIALDIMTEDEVGEYATTTEGRESELRGEPNLSACTNRDEHDEDGGCRGEIWYCAGCRAPFCYAEGADDEHFDYCNQCAETREKAGITKKGAR